MATHDIFISYRRKDTDRVRPLVDSLRAKGVSVWFDQNQIDEFAPITQKIRDGLANSKSLLAWYSVDYPRSRPCQMELTAAFLAAQREGDPRKRVWVINPESTASHVQPIELRDEQHAAAPKEPVQYEALAKTLVQRVTTLSGLLGGIVPITAPQQYGQRLVSARHFVGRVADLWQIHSALSGGETAIISGESGSGVAQLSGIGGVGKSLLAEEYALRFSAAYPGGIFWLRALGNDAARPSVTPEEQAALRSDQFRSFAVALDILVRDLSPEEILARLAIKLGSTNQPFLWIVDDLASGLDNTTVRAWLPPHPLGKTLFTTRSREYEEIGNCVALGGLPAVEAVELLCAYRKPNDKDEMVAAEGIAADLGYHPLALAVCSRALAAEAGMRSFAEFRSALANKTADELALAAELKGSLPNDHEKSVAATLLRSVRKLAPAAQDLLRIAASVAAAPIPPSLIAATLADADALAGPQALICARLARSQVRNASLAEESESEGLSIHTLVSRAMRFHDKDQKRCEKLRSSVIRALNRVLPTVADIRTHVRLQLEMIHARELCTTRMSDPDSATLGLWVARYDFERGAYIVARKLQEQVVEASCRNLGEKDTDTLISMGNLACFLSAEGDLVGARRIQEQVFASFQQEKGDDHPDTLTASSNLAETLKVQGDLMGAHQLEQRTLEARRRVLGDNHPDTLTSMNNVSETLRFQGHLADARELGERVLEGRRRVLGNDHPMTLVSIGNLAKTLCAQGEYHSARELGEQVVEVWRRICGEEHPDTLRSFMNLAAIEFAAGNLVAAHNIHHRALDLCQRIFGRHHPDALAAMNNLANSLRVQGEPSKAIELHKEVLATCRVQLGEEHPHTLTSKSNYALDLKAIGDVETARELQSDVLEARRRVLGQTHPDAISSMTELAITLSDQDELSAARDLEIRVLEIRREVYGEEHPETFAAEWNLLWTHHKLRETQAAHAVAKRLTRLLDRDPNTLGPTLRQIRNQLEDYMARYLSQD